MLSIFPELLTYSLLAPFLLRIALGIIFIRFGMRSFRPAPTHDESTSTPAPQKSKTMRAIGIVEAIGGLLLLVGFYTQAAALVLSLIVLGALSGKIFHRSRSRSDADYYKILLFAATLSLLFTGAGAFAFDLPL